MLNLPLLDLPLLDLPLESLPLRSLQNWPSPLQALRMPLPLCRPSSRQKVGSLHP
jgi:hypothetical protein